MNTVTPSAPRSSHPTRWSAGAALAALLTLVLGLFAAAPAQAHDELVASNPAAEEQLDQVPEEVVLTYSAEIMDIGNAIEITDPQGEVVSQGEPVVEGRDISQAISGADAEGTYTVTWRVVSSDGHPIEGRYEFTVGTAGGTGSDAASDSSSAAQDDASTEAAENAAEQAESQGINPLVWVLLGVLVLAVVIAVVVYSTRRGRDENRGA